MFQCYVHSWYSRNEGCPECIVFKTTTTDDAVSVKTLNEDDNDYKTKYYQALGALGYPVPGDIREDHTLKCGLCEAKEKRLFALSLRIDEIANLCRVAINKTDELELKNCNIKFILSLLDERLMSLK